MVSSVFRTAIIKNIYHISLRKNKVPNYVIYALDNRTFQNGFSDRLRGIVSSYAYAKLNNLQFKIEHIDPFRLEMFFEPSKIDWILKEGEKSNNLLDSRPIVLLDYTKGKRLLYQSKHKQLHIYSNINALPVLNSRYSVEFSFNDLFKELFKPSQFLLERIKPFEHYIQNGYISISFRFLQLMGDFLDCCGYTLSQMQQQELLSRCICMIREIHIRHTPVPYILVTSDSKKLIDSIKDLDYVFVIPGEIGHIGYAPKNEVNTKMILDFYMISQAQKAYLGCSGDMYKSSFAKTAAETTGIPFEIVNF